MVKKISTFALITVLFVAIFALPSFADEVGEVRFYVNVPSVKYTTGDYFSVYYDRWYHRFDNEQVNEIRFEVERIDVHNATTGEWEHTQVNISVVNLDNPQATLGMKSVIIDDWNAVPTGVQLREGGSVIPFSDPQRVDKGSQIWMVSNYVEEYNLQVTDTSVRNVWLYVKANEYNNHAYYQGIIDQLDQMRVEAQTNLYKPLTYLDEAAVALDTVVDGFPFLIPIAVAGVGIGVISLALYGTKGL